MNVRIIGLGNVLMSDAGFGPYVVRVLEAFYEMPDNVQIVDAGAPGFDLTPSLLGADLVIFVEAAKDAGAAGDIHVYRKPDILARFVRFDGGAHDSGVRDALMTATLAGRGPSRVLLIRVNPEWVATGVALSASIRTAVAPAIGLILTELERLGCRVGMRPVPRQPDTWWERDAPAEISGVPRTNRQRGSAPAAGFP